MDGPSRNPWTLIRRVRQLVTLQGPSGPRRGTAMRELQVVQDAALLVHDGVVRDSGTARRIENLAEARRAVEIDAGGRLAMPAFVEADTVLISPGADAIRAQSAEAFLTTASKRVLESMTRNTVEDWVRHGVLAVGSATHGAKDLRDARKLLNIQKTFQTRPIRIRSVFSPSDTDLEETSPEEAVRQWAGSIVEKRLAGLLELEIPPDDRPAEMARLEAIIQHAVPQGFILRLRAETPLSERALHLIHRSGAISVLAPGMATPPAHEFARASCLWVVRTTDILKAGPSLAGTRETAVRQLLDQGWALALASGYRGARGGTFNPQYLLQLACCRLGMSIEEAITATTWNAACSLRMSTVAGSVEPGKQADLAILDVRDYRDLAERHGHNDIYMVLRAGKPIYRRAGVLLPEVN